MAKAGHVTNKHFSRRALPSSSNPSSLISSNSATSRASNPRILPTAFLLGLLLLSSSSLASRALADLTGSQVPQVLFPDMAWALRRRLLAMACRRRMDLPVKVSRRLLPAHFLRTTSLCRLGRPASRDPLRCKALPQDPLEVEASRVHRSRRLLKRPSRRPSRPT